MPLPDFCDIAARLQSAGRSAISAEEATALAALFVKEARKGAFRYDKFDAVTTAGDFFKHVTQEFGPSAAPTVVVDYTYTLLRHARASKSEPHPIASVILYATWVEHWLNATLITKALRVGRLQSDAAQMVRDVNLPGKLGWLWRDLQLPEIADGDVVKLRLLAEVRNEFVHYKWKGKDPSVLDGPDQRLSAALVGIEETLARLQHLTSAHLDAPFVADAHVLFGIDMGVIMADLWEFGDA